MSAVDNFEEEIGRVGLPPNYIRVQDPKQQTQEQLIEELKNGVQVLQICIDQLAKLLSNLTDSINDRK